MITGTVSKARGALSIAGLLSTGARARRRGRKILIFIGFGPSMFRLHRHCQPVVSLPDRWSICISMHAVGLPMPVVPCEVQNPNCATSTVPPAPSPLPRPPFCVSAPQDDQDDRCRPRNVTLSARHSENPGKHEDRFPGIPGCSRLFSEIPGVRLLGEVPRQWGSSGRGGLMISAVSSAWTGRSALRVGLRPRHSSHRR